MKKAAILGRISTASQNLESQIEDLKADAERFGYTVPEEFIFAEQITGMDKADAEERQSLANLKKAIESKKGIEACFIWELTRVSRNPYKLVDSIGWFTNHKMPIFFHDLERWTLDKDTLSKDLETESRIFGAALYGQRELDKIRDRMSRGRMLVAAKGQFVGQLSDGYCVEKRKDGKYIVIDEDREGVIKKIFQLFVYGNSTDRIAKILNADGILTPVMYRVESPKFHHKLPKNVSNWSGSLVAQILSNRWYIGERTYKDVIYHHDPIIDMDLWDKVRAMSEDRRKSYRTKKVSTKHKYLLANKMFCGKCGMKMYGHTTGLNNHYYCSSTDNGEKCGLVGSCKENIEAIIYQMIYRRCHSNLYQLVHYNEHEEDNPFIDFFKQSDVSIEQIKSQITQNEKIIANNEKEKAKEQKNLEEYAKQLVSASNDYVKKAFETNMSKSSATLEELDKETLKLLAENIKLQKKLNQGSSVKGLLDSVEKLDKTKDLDVIGLLFDEVISKVTYYNCDVSCNIIHVEYTNGEEDDILYAHRLMKTSFLPLGFMHLRYDAIMNTLIPIWKDITDNTDIPFLGIDMSSGYTRPVIDRMDWLPYYAWARGLWTNEELIIFEERLTPTSENYREGYNLDNFYEEYPSLANIRLEDTDWVLIDDNGISPRELIEHIKRWNTQLFDPFVRLESTTEEAEQQKLKYKEWRKKYNNGKPTNVPTVIRDDDYEAICAERKRLYNKKYKIKNRKKLAEEEKQQLLQQIDDQLALLMAKVKHIEKSK